MRGSLRGSKDRGGGCRERAGPQLGEARRLVKMASSKRRVAGRYSWNQPMDSDCLEGCDGPPNLHLQRKSLDRASQTKRRQLRAMRPLRREANRAAGSCHRESYGPPQYLQDPRLTLQRLLSRNRTRKTVAKAGKKPRPSQTVSLDQLADRKQETSLPSGLDLGAGARRVTLYLGRGSTRQCHDSAEGQIRSGDTHLAFSMKVGG